jgi:cell wall-associated NlpC family hydrolase
MPSVGGPDHREEPRQPGLLKRRRGGDDTSTMRLVPRVLVVAAIIAATLLPARAAFAFTDVPKNYWDYQAIQYVAVTNAWMQDYGPDTFRPTIKETRGFLARALVLAYAPAEATDPSITFPDLPSDDPLYPYANVSVKLGWVPKYSTGKFGPNDAVMGSLVDYALIKATGLFEAPLAGLAAIHEGDGTPYVVRGRWPHMMLSRYLGLHYNHSDDKRDIGAKSKVNRDEVAYSLWKASTLPAWKVDSTARYSDITLIGLSGSQQVKHDLTQEALDQVGYPYVWSGEWNAKTPPGYCCGYQPQGGFDCSGFVWWVMKKNEDGYNAAKYRAYPGWSLHDRSSSSMAKNTGTHLAFDKLRVGDLMFFSSNGGKKWSDVNHVGLYVGSGWMIHSSGSIDGPVIEWVADGYYRNNYVYGRRLIGTPPKLNSTPHSQLLAGDSA